MPTHNQHLPEGHKNEEVDTSLGYEASDVKATGILVFLVAMGIFVVVTAVTCYGIGKLMNARMDREDGPNSKWTKTVDVRQLGNLPSSPELQNKMAEITQSFPAPRVQIDNGDQDIADLHAREDILLDNYTWANQAQGKVRIPIERAMEIIAQRGLPVAPAVETGPLMIGDSRPTVTMPLTDGFARTTYEQEEAAAHNEPEAVNGAQSQ
ncbi:MAG TPA: hypothetical protein VHX20_04730 [Terracidiphilus sp.]|jgi:hypothetical protein|nr:hypothetical protein [Terracidiphilus sp.]